MEVQGLAVALACISGASTLLLLRLRPRLIGSKLSLPVTALFLSIALASAAGALANVSLIQRAWGVATGLSLLSAGVATIEIPAFLHMASRFPRNLESPLVRGLVALSYGTAAAMLVILPTEFGVASEVAEEGHIHLAAGGPWSALSLLQTMALMGTIIWIAYLSARGVGADERNSARGLLVAGGVPTVAGIAVVVAGAGLTPPLDPTTLGVAWWVGVIFLVVSTGRLEFRVLPPIPKDVATLGERPLVRRGRLPVSQARRNALFIALAALLAWLTFLNTYWIRPEDTFGRTVYNQVSIIVFSVVLAYAAYRAGAKGAQLAQSAMATLESLPLGLAVLSPNYKVEFANRALMAPLGFEEKDLLGRRAATFLSEEDADRIASDHAKRTLGQTSSYRLRMKTKGGGGRDAIVTMLPYERQGFFDGVLAVVNDISEVVELRREAEHQSSLASFLSDAVTHDLSNAIQVALGRIQLAAQLAGAPGDRLFAALRDAEDSAQRSVRLIKEVKQIAIAERDRWPRSDIRFREILQEAVGSTGFEGSPRLRVDLAGEVLAARVKANGLLATALAKIIEEAAETAASSQAQLVARGRLLNGGHLLQIEVEGSARAYTPEDFEMISKGPSGYHWGDTPWRCGVRIALAAAVLRAHGGTLAASHGPGGKGTAYAVTLPVGERPTSPFEAGVPPAVDTGGTRA